MSKPSGPRLWDEFGWNEDYKGKGTTVLDYPEKPPEPVECTSTTHHDPVDKPEHYNNNAIECIVYMKDNMTAEAFQGYLEGCAKKYLHRFKYKGKAKQDLQKAQWYLNKLIEEQE